MIVVMKTVMGIGRGERGGLYMSLLSYVHLADPQTPGEPGHNVTRSRKNLFPLRSGPWGQKLYFHQNQGFCQSYS